MKCSKCGKEITNDSNFCEYCGTKVKAQKNPTKSTSKSNTILWIVLAFIFGIIWVIIILLLAIAGNYYNVQDNNANRYYYPEDSTKAIEEVVDDSYPVDTICVDACVDSNNYIYPNENNFVIDYLGGYDNRKTVYINSNESWYISTSTASWAHCEQEGDYVTIWCDHNPDEGRDDYIILTSASGQECRIDFHQN